MSLRGGYSAVPTIDVTIGSLPDDLRRRLVERMTAVFTTPDTPSGRVTIVFRHIDPGDFGRGGHSLMPVLPA
jgi:phenylpyruvate tautomerase PptA (4-oxalocrotonate tautomerase family)